jgi:hypothetical protein|tara:strand:- start:4497 stop:4844 length:348 start_codon:yes stop_codon:yes gene_type:complete
MIYETLTNFRNQSKKFGRLGDLDDSTPLILLAPRIDDETYDKREAVCVDGSEQKRIKKAMSEGWDVMLAYHYFERLELDNYVPEDHSYLRGITDHVYHPELGRKEIQWPQKKNVQ